jgi:nicotinate-nucleotide adenylyltransferase
MGTDRDPGPVRVALYGGSFNPAHVAHQMVALYVLETAAVDQLWLLPAYEHALGKPLAPFADRLAMCQLAAAALGPRVIVSDIERTLAGRAGRCARSAACASSTRRTRFRW